MSETPRQRPPSELVPYTGDASVRLEGVDLAWTVPVVALSGDALLVRVPATSEGGSLVHVELTTGAELVQGMGEVVSAQPAAWEAESHELLIRFLFLDEPSRGVLRRLVEQARSQGAALDRDGSPSNADAELVGEALVDAAEVGGDVEQAAPADGSPEWVLDPIDPDQALDPELPELLGSAGASLAEPPTGSVLAAPGVADAHGALVGGDAEPAAPLAPPEAAHRDPAGSAEPAEPAAPAGGHYGAARRRSAAPVWGLSAVLLVAILLAAAWWTREVWLDGAGAAPERSASPGDAAARSSEPSGAEPTEVTRTAWTPVETSPEAGGPPGESPGAGTAAPEAEAAEQPASDGPAPPQDPTPGGDPAPDPLSVAAGGSAAGAGSPSGSVEVRAVDVTERDGETVVSVTLSAPLPAGDLDTFSLSDPPRFVVRLLGVATDRSFAGATAQLSRIRTGLHVGPNGRPETRLVLDLGAESVQPTITRAGARLEVVLRGVG
ncbi:MAG TPA: hypothetical protein VMV46_18455 [Thermoanaerobaculia bacterium]|nr:hypothetical protein [Thermoanaerobaculia bacterium]